MTRDQHGDRKSHLAETDRESDRERTSTCELTDNCLSDAAGGDAAPFTRRSWLLLLLLLDIGIRRHNLTHSERVAALRTVRCQFRSAAGTHHRTCLCAATDRLHLRQFVSLTVCSFLIERLRWAPAEISFKGKAFAPSWLTFCRLQCIIFYRATQAVAMCKARHSRRKLPFPL